MKRTAGIMILIILTMIMLAAAPPTAAGEEATQVLGDPRPAEHLAVPGSGLNKDMKRRAAVFTTILALLMASPATRALGFGDYEYALGADGYVTITKYLGAGARVTIPGALGGRPVTAIGERAFSGKNTVAGLTIPDGVAGIGAYAFEYCQALERVSIGGGVKSIGANPFVFCEALKSIEVPADHGALKVIDQALFFEPEKRLITSPCGLADREYIIPDGTEIIGAHAFVGCYALTGVTITDGVKVVGSVAFLHCTGLQRVDLGGGIEEIGTNPFVNCKSLNTVRVAPDHQTLELTDGMLILKPDMRLIGCPCECGAESFEVPEGIRAIGGGAFAYCDRVKEIALPESVVRIEGEAFLYCGALEDVNLPGGLTEIELVTFYGCAALKSVTLPERVTSIGPGAFHGCSALESLTLPESVTCIAKDAFDRCDALTLTVYPGSYAAKYAGERKLPRVYPTPSTD